MKKYYGSRSKISLLPHQVRWRIYNLLLDGATLKAVLNDPEVKTALERAGFTFNSGNLAAIRKNREFIDFVRLRQEYLERKYKDMMSAAIARGTGSLESMTDQARCKLMEALSGMSDLLATAKQGEDGSDESRIKALRSLAQSVAALSNPVKDSQIAELKHRLAESEKQNAALHAEIDRLKNDSQNRPASDGLSETAIRQAEEKIKLL